MMSFAHNFDCILAAITPGDFSSRPKHEWKSNESRIHPIDGYKVPLAVRIYAGQPDPNDPSHFTIRYQMWGKEDILDGRLGNDDQVTLTPRNRPTEP
jgi:hypothetical protein